MAETLLERVEESASRMVGVENNMVGASGGAAGW